MEQQMECASQHIEQDIREFVIDSFIFGSGHDDLSNDDSFLEKGLVDSLGILSLVTFVQDKYSISVENEELVTDNWDSVSRIATFVQRKLDSKG